MAVIARGRGKLVRTGEFSTLYWCWQYRHGLYKIFIVRREEGRLLPRKIQDLKI